MKFSILGAGSWGTTLAQVLVDNGHDVLLYDINEDTLKAIKQGSQPLLDYHDLPPMKTTNNLKELVGFSHYILIAIPTAYIRQTLSKINPLLTTKTHFINVSKGIEPETLKRVSEIVIDEINENVRGEFCLLAGPSHAEELILRQLTMLTASSNNLEFAKVVQNAFNNANYLRVYTNNDLIGSEIGGFVKNAIAVAAGISTGFGYHENARAALITKGIKEIMDIVDFMGGKKETVFGLTGIGDLIVTASSEHSRNFKAGVKIGRGENADKVLLESKMVVEGIRSIIAMNFLAQKNNLDLPIIQTSYKVIKGIFTVEEALNSLLSRELKSESITF